MKLSKETLTILNNFSNINENILIKEGKNIRTRDEAKSVYAEANLDIDFPQDFGISSLKNFLNTYNIFNEPELTFYDDRVVIKEDSAEYIYRRASERVLSYPPYDKNVVLSDPKASFSISKEQLKNIIKAANSIKSLASSKESCISFFFDNGKIITESKMMKDEPMKNAYRISLDIDENLIKDNKFNAVINSSKVNLVDGDYLVTVYDRFVEFRNTQIDLFYVISCEVM